MYFMIFIFLLELIFAFLPNFGGNISVQISKLLFKVSDEELNIRSEVADLKQEQAGLSVTDDFARYARLQRKVEKLMNAVKAKVQKRKEHTAYVKVGVTVGIYAIHALLMLFLMVYMRNQPLMELPDGWVYPVHKFVAFPTGIPGAVGLGCWVVVSNSVIYRIKQVMGL